MVCTVKDEKSIESGKNRDFENRNRYMTLPSVTGEKMITFSSCCFCWVLFLFCIRQARRSQMKDDSD